MKKNISSLSSISILILLLLIFVSIIILIDNLIISKKIEGRVINSENKPLKDVRIQVLNSAYFSKTDKFGNYSIDYAPGKFTLIFTKDGFCKKNSFFKHISKSKI